MQDTMAKDIIEQYIEAFRSQDLQRCVDLFGSDASLEFGPATYQGRANLEDWHKTRFAANLQLIRIDDMTVDGDTVVIDGAITSKRLKAWRIGTLSGRATFKVCDGKIADARFGLRSYNPIESIRLHN